MVNEEMDVVPTKQRPPPKTRLEVINDKISRVHEPCLQTMSSNHVFIPCLHTMPSNPDPRGFWDEVAGRRHCASKRPTKGIPPVLLVLFQSMTVTPAQARVRTAVTFGEPVCLLFNSPTCLLCVSIYIHKRAPRQKKSKKIRVIENRYQNPRKKTPSARAAAAKSSKLLTGSESPFALLFCTFVYLLGPK